MPQNLIELYRELTIARLRSDIVKLENLVSEAKKQDLTDIWLTLLDMEKAYMRSISEGLEEFRKKGYEFFEETEDEHLSVEKILLYSTWARGLVNSGTPDNLHRGFQVCKGLTRSLPTDPTSESDLFLWWVVHHYKALAADYLNMQQESIPSYTALISRLEHDLSDHSWLLPFLCLSISNRGIANYWVGNLDQAAKDFRKAVTLHSDLPAEHKLGIPENNLADLYRFVLVKYGDVFNRDTSQWLAREIDRLSSAALEEIPEDPIFLYNEAFRAYEAKQYLIAKNKFQDSFKNFSKHPARPENVAGALAAYCMKEFAEEQAGKGKPKWQSILEDESHAHLSRRKTEAKVTREFLSQALNQHDMFINGVLTELNLHRKILIAPKTIENRNSFAVLRRWNSFTPCLPIGEQRAEGGGYFISWNGNGLVVDPGFDFIKHFLGQQFSLGDIDGILITHAHLDHCIELDSILTLLYERYNEIKKLGQEPEENKVSLFLSLGAAMKAIPWVGTLAQKSDIIGPIKILAPDENVDHADLGDIHIQAYKASHADILTSKHCLSIRLFLQSPAAANPTVSSIFLTSDTAWSDKLYDNCDADMVIVHIGTVSVAEAWISAVLKLSPNIYKRLTSPKEAGSTLVTEDIARGLGLPYEKSLDRFRDHFKNRKFSGGEDHARLPKQHLGLTGVIRLAKEFRKTGKLFVVSEFGQELGIFRASIAPTLQKLLGKNEQEFPRFLTGDAGLEISLENAHVRCNYCNMFHSADGIREIASLARDREIRFVCPGCYHQNIDRIISDLRLGEIIDQAREDQS